MVQPKHLFVCLASNKLEKLNITKRGLILLNQAVIKDGHMLLILIFSTLTFNLSDPHVSFDDVNTE